MLFAEVKFKLIAKDQILEQFSLTRLKIAY